jgi:hypothetical protein
MPINFFKHLAGQYGDHILKILPPAHLSEMVEGFYILKAGVAEERELFFNDGYPVLALMQSRDSNIKISVEGKIENVGSMWVCGGVLRNVYCESNFQFKDCLVIRFYAVTFYKLFGISEGLFQQKQVFNLSAIVAQGFESFKDTYYDSSSVKERIEVTISFLTEKMKAYSYPKLLTDIQTYMDRQGNLNVKDVLDGYTVRLNYKWLERNFKKHMGISPQSYLLTRRFLKAYIDLDVVNPKDLLQVAIDNGYYDDNHFIKDFRRFCGVPPKTYFKRPVKALD